MTVIQDMRYLVNIEITKHRYINASSLEEAQDKAEAIADKLGGFVLDVWANDGSHVLADDES